MLTTEAPCMARKKASRPLRERSPDERHTKQLSVAISVVHRRRLEQIIKAEGMNSLSEGVRWCIDQAWPMRQGGSGRQAP